MRDPTPHRSTTDSHPSDTWPWPPEVPRRPDQPPGPPPAPPGPPLPPLTPAPPQRPGPEPILPSWEEPVPPPLGLDLDDRLLEERVVLVHGHLDDDLAEETTRKLLLLGRRAQARPVELHLSCRASDLAASLALAAAIDLNGAPVRATVSGTLAGPVVAALCAATVRIAHRHATIVLTVPSDGSPGLAQAEVATRAEEHARMVAEVVERVAGATGRPPAEVAEDLRTGRVLPAEEARGYGLVDRVQ